ncbi:F-actin-capping protein subunit alpha-2, putative [Entamoeba invadens IP1]|uniref:F-actin-capping protein subunit alpha n=1 Tax=Entamoeba invadens TaxID=33085 RepID=S0B4E9_ENTIV|nr:F-actin-capping protein subunit alpha-2, putative [Entamoeba invadens IP1]ELP90471.1 F-actin-capping protein subunit alpha-2, putative [Entamoeba invadens IP1]BAN40745.1 F-actin-capping protein subunit alpha-2, putative [Entamoeba invadens]BAN40968.1 F-actin-capping protein subunit alpha-2, putative [Entamoeba invadens]BAN41401.1 F-actin-capping protein subunit alpha-2, putative [Entamoeba invadens]|eukprot:XP_004257242.1 F-actin-capping protein subunit alpha-2, putative [Entamoeba invadens IP1]
MSSQETKIVASFLKDSPPGEFNNVLKDCKQLVENDDIFQQCLPTCLHDYNTEQLTVVQDGSNNVIISKQTEKNPNEFIDPIHGKLMSFDHIKKAITSSSGLSEALPGSDSLRNSIQNKLDAYCREFYPKGAGVVMPKDANSYYVIISSADFKAAQFSNGKWRSEWTVTLNGSKASIEGRIRVQEHYFEDANIQMHTDVKKKATANASGDDQTAQSVISEIKKIEEQFQTELVKIFDTLSENCLKALRRQLPMSKQKINWQNWKAHKMMSK